MNQTVFIPYGRGTAALHVPGQNLRAVLTPRHEAQPLPDERQTVLHALEHPINSARLCEQVRGKRRILLITSDHTRPVPSAVTLPLLLQEIRAGSPNAEITILIATGMHRATTEREMRLKFGDALVDRERIVVHNAFDDSAMTFFGTLPSGGELWLNSLVKQADFVLSEGFIEPHFFAGFSGGRKSILPGVASARTVLYNHNAGFIQNRHARQGVLDDNPVHRDMCFAARQAGLGFILNVLLDSQKRIVAAVAGEPEAAHREGCRQSEAAARLNPVISDIAVTSNGGYPLDQNLYQSVKGMTAAESCVRQGGAIIMCAALGDGHGGEAFFRWFRDHESARDVLQEIQSVPAGETRPDQWQAQILARVMCRAHCWFVTGEENRALVEAMHLRWAPDPDTALAQAFALLGETASVTVIPDGVSVIF